MTLMNLQKEIVSMIAKCGSETLVVNSYDFNEKINEN